MSKRNLILVAIAAALPTLAGAQSPTYGIGIVVNPEDSGYHASVSDNPYQAKAVAPRASSAASMMPVTVNPDDAGYHAVITENPYKGKPAQSPTALSSRFRAVLNPEDAGYLGSVN